MCMFPPLCVCIEWSSSHAASHCISDPQCNFPSQPTSPDLPTVQHENVPDSSSRTEKLTNTFPNSQHTANIGEYGSPQCDLPSQPNSPAAVAFQQKGVPDSSPGALELANTFPNPQHTANVEDYGSAQHDLPFRPISPAVPAFQQEEVLDSSPGKVKINNKFPVPQNVANADHFRSSISTEQQKPHFSSPVDYFLPASPTPGKRALVSGDSKNDPSSKFTQKFQGPSSTEELENHYEQPETSEDAPMGERTIPLKDRMILAPVREDPPVNNTRIMIELEEKSESVMSAGPVETFSGNETGK